MAEINLLPVDERKNENLEKLRKNLSVFSTIALFAVAGFALVTLIFFTRLIGERREIISRIEAASSMISSFENTEALLVVTKSKTSLASDVLNSRTDHIEFFNNFSSIIPTNVYFSDIKFTSGKVTFTGKAKTSADLAGLVASLASPDGSKLISTVSIDSLSADEERIYSFGISALVVGEEREAPSTSSVGAPPPPSLQESKEELSGKDN